MKGKNKSSSGKISDLEFDTEKIGAVGGIVPSLTNPPEYKNTESLKYFNEMFCDENGENLSWNNNGGHHWRPPAIVKSHHLRSSWLFKREAIESVGLFEEWVGPSGFGDEPTTCLKMLDKGWELYTDTQAIAWHLFAAGPKKRDLGEKPYSQHCKDNFFQMQKMMKPCLKRLYKKGILVSGMGTG